MQEELEWLRELEQQLPYTLPSLKWSEAMTCVAEVRRRINLRIIALLSEVETGQVYPDAIPGFPIDKLDAYEERIDAQRQQQYECDGHNCPPRAHDHKVGV